MPAPILATKLYVPPSRRSLVLRPRLIERLDEGLAAGSRLILVSAPAGFGKTTLVSEWVAGCGRPVALAVAGRRRQRPGPLPGLPGRRAADGRAGIGDGVLAMLRVSPAPAARIDADDPAQRARAPPGRLSSSSSTTTTSSTARPVDEALAFLLEHLPPQMHLVIATREDPACPWPGCVPGAS